MPTLLPRRPWLTTGYVLSGKSGTLLDGRCFADARASVGVGSAWWEVGVLAGLAHAGLRATKPKTLTEVSGSTLCGRCQGCQRIPCLLICEHALFPCSDEYTRCTIGHSRTCRPRKVSAEVPMSGSSSSPAAAS
jgi:hypothetical protein